MKKKENIKTSKTKTSKRKNTRKKRMLWKKLSKCLKKEFHKRKKIFQTFLKKQKKKYLKSVKNYNIHKYLPLIVGTILLIVVVASMNFDDTSPTAPVVFEPTPILNEPSPKIKGMDIHNLQETYQNEDIIGYIEIPNVISYPIVKSSDNTYYLNHLLDHSQNIKGSPFMDYRVYFDDRKVLIYGHSGKEEDLPFLQLHRYEDASFYENHPTIYLYSMEKIYTYQIFSSYLEENDYDYVNINSFRGLSWLEHIQKLQNKSDFSTNISLTEESKILILQTCNVEENYVGGKYRLLIGVLDKTEDNEL